MDSILLLTFVFLVAGVAAVPIASRLGLGSVLGYLLAGIAISPLLHQLNVDVVSIQHIAEFRFGARNEHAATGCSGANFQRVIDCPVLADPAVVLISNRVA